MKIAVCLVGYPAHAGRYTDNIAEENPKIIDISYETFEKYILEPNKKSIDLYIHSWNTQYLDYYLNTFQPKKYIIEDQPNENRLCFFPQNDSFYIFDEITNANQRFKNKKLKHMYMRAYAFQQLCELFKKETYDLYVLTRPDLYWMNPVDFSKLDFDLIHISDWIRFIQKNNEVLPAHRLYETFLYKKDILKRYSVEFMGYPQSTSIQDLIFAMNHSQFMTLQFFLDNMGLYVNKIKDIGDGIKSHTLWAAHFDHYGFISQKKLKFSFRHLRDYSLTRYFLQAQELMES